MNITTTKTNNNDNPMISGSVIKTFFHYSIPWMLALLLISSAGIVDGIFVGRYIGAMSIAAVNIILPIFSLLVGVGLVLATGGSVKFSYYIGLGDIQSAKAIFTKTMIVIIASCLVIQIASLIFAEETVRLLGARDELVAPTLKYFQVLMFFGMLPGLGYALSMFTRADGHPVIASCSLITGSLLNILFDYLFIVKFNLGISGAAYATGLSQCCALIPMLIYICFPNCNLRFTSKLGEWRELCKTIYNGSSEFINEISSGIIIFAYNRIIISHIGVEGVAGFAVISYILFLGLLIIYGFSDSLAMLVSANMAAGQLKRIRHYYFTCIGTVLLAGCLIVIGLSFWGNYLVGLFFPSSPNILNFTNEFMSILKWLFPFGALNIASASFFTGLHHSFSSLVIAALRGIILPVLLLVVLPEVLGRWGIYWASPISEICTTFVVIFIFAKSKFKLTTPIKGVIINIEEKQVIC